MGKTYKDWPDKSTKHTVSYAQHKKNVAKAGGGGGGGGGGGKPPDAARVTARAKKDPAFLARALKNPGLRSKITDISLLPKDLQQERTLNAPIVAGSTMTGRDLRRQSTAEVATDYAIPESEYAQQLKAAQQHQGDVGGWYDQYQAQIAAASQRIGQAQDQAVAGTQAMSGVGAQQAGQLAGQAAAAVAPGTTVAADIAQSAGQGTAARENLVSSYVGQAQQQAGTQKALGNWMTGVVAPGQKVQALTTAQRAIDTVRDKQSALAVKKGAELLKTRADIRQQEIANTVALQQLGNQTLTAKTNAAANTPAAKTAAAGATAGIDVDKSNAVKAGVSLKTWQAMTPAQQAKAMKAMNPAKTDSLDKAFTDPKDPFFGLTPAQVARHSQTWRDQRITHAYGLTHPGKDGKDGTSGKGDWAPQGQMGAALTQASQLKGWAAKAKAGLKFEPTGKEKKPGKPLPRNGPNSAAQKIRDYAGKNLKDPILLTAALDAVYDGHLSATTIRGLIAAKYQPGRVAKALGVPTAGQIKGTTATTYGGGAGAGSGIT